MPGSRSRARGSPAPGRASEGRTASKRVRPAASDGRGRREEILDVAIDRFARSGFDGVRLREIARAAGMNQATLVYYFPSKRALYEACLSRVADELQDVFRSATSSPDGRIAADRIVSDLLARFARRPELGRLIRHATLGGGDEFDRAFVKPLRPWFTRGVAALERAMDEGIIERQDAEELVLILYGAILIYLSEDPLVVGLTRKDPRAPRNLRRHQQFVLEAAGKLLEPRSRGGRRES